LWCGKLVYRKLAGKDIKKAHLAMLSAKLPVVQRLARAIEDRSLLIAAISSYLKNPAEERKYTVVEVQEDSEFEFADTVVHVVLSEDELGRTVVRVHPRETEKGPNFKCSRDNEYGFRVLALLRFEKDRESAFSYRTTIGHTTTTKLNQWLQTFKERVTGQKRKRTRKVGASEGEEGEKPPKAKSKKDKKASAKAGEEAVDEKTTAAKKAEKEADAKAVGEKATVAKKDEVSEASVKGGGAKASEAGEDERAEPTRLERHVASTEGDGEFDVSSKGRAADAGGGGHYYYAGPGIHRVVPFYGLERTEEDKVFYAKHEFVPIPYVVPEAFISLEFRQQPIAHLVLDRGVPNPQHICCIIARPGVYVELFHALVHAKKLEEVKTVALLVPTAFSSADR
jgi:hypothetical protein